MFEGGGGERKREPTTKAYIMQKLNNHRVVKKGQNPGALVFHPAKPASKIELISGNENMDEDETVRNCIGCGFIYTSAKYAELDACVFCARPLTMKSKKENRRRREEGEE